MQRERTLYLGLGILGVGTAAFVGSRIALRRAVTANLQANPYYRQAQTAANIGSVIGFDLGIPKPEELAESLVPLLSTISPYQAGEDIQRRGRQSRYWPKKYKRSDIPPQVEQMIIAALVSVSQAQDQKQKQAQIAA